MDVEVHDLGDEIEEKREPGRPKAENFHKTYREYDWNSHECAEGLAACRDEALVIRDVDIRVEPYC